MSDLTRLQWQCRRGSLELDLLVQRYIARHNVLNDKPAQARLTELLKLEDDELFALLMGEFLTET
ncbi:MAG: succinate dehydrogenase assembly factor 2 [Methylococcaceae bacterium]